MHAGFYIEQNERKKRIKFKIGLKILRETNLPLVVINLKLSSIKYLSTDGRRKHRR